MPITLTETLIAAHERLYPRIAALLKQVERGRGNGRVPEETGRLARELCLEAAKLLGREGRGIALPKAWSNAKRPAPLDHTALAVVLGQVVAGLEAFEAAHSAPVDGVPSWQLSNGATRPVARLRAKAGSAPRQVPLQQVPRSRYDETPEQMRSVVIKRLMQRENERYMQGYRDAKAGKPPIRPITEIEPVPRGGNYVSSWRGGEPIPPLPPDD